MKTEAELGVREAFGLRDRVVVVTGAAGLLGRRHVAAIAEMGGIPVVADVTQSAAAALAQEVGDRYGVPSLGLAFDVTDPSAVQVAGDTVMARFGRVDGLVNNAANNPKVETQGDSPPWSRFEGFPLSVWQDDIAVGLTGAFLCAQVFGTLMARQGRGVILNIASDLSVIAPDQRIYRTPGLPADRQPAKPVSYSVVKAGLVGLTKYLSTYWAEQGVRVNALSPGGVYAGQEEAFVARLTQLIPLGRMAREDEYQAAVVFLLSDASSYLTGQNIVMDGGRSTW